MVSILRNYNSSQDLVPVDEDRPIDAIIAAILPLLASFYLLTATIAHGVLVNRPCHDHQRPTTARQRNRTEARIRMIILVATCIIFCRQIARTVEMSQGFTDDRACFVLRKLTDVLFAVAITLIYFALWLRQRVFYHSPLSASLNNKFTRILSAFAILIMIVGSVGGIVLYLATQEYSSSENGCILNNTSVPAVLPGAYYVTAVVLLQLILLFLFAYPILRLNSPFDKTMSLTLSKVTYNVLKRIAIIAVVDLTLDVVVIVTIQILYNSLSSTYQFILYDVILIKSCVCIICSFRDWRLRFCPFSCRCRSNQREDFEMDTL